MIGDLFIAGRGRGTGIVDIILEMPTNNRILSHMGFTSFYMEDLDPGQFCILSFGRRGFGIYTQHRSNETKLIETGKR
jgi:hypothetical protein